MVHGSEIAAERKRVFHEISLFEISKYRQSKVKMKLRGRITFRFAGKQTKYTRDGKRGQSALEVGSLSYSSVRWIAYTSGAYIVCNLFLTDCDLKFKFSIRML
jgi:hypothetical protein